MIDYNYYTTLENKELEKLISHIKNIQHQRVVEFSTAFLNADIDTVNSLLPNINTDKLTNTFSSYVNQFDDSEKNIDFYLFLKTNDITKSFDFQSIENNICWKYATPELLEKIKIQLPDTFTSFKNKAFQCTNKDLIIYLERHDFIDFEKVKTNHSASDEIITYMMDKNMFKNFEEFPFYQWFPLMGEQLLSKVRSDFSLDKFDFQNLYSHSSENLMRTYLKNSFKYKTPDFLDNFTITSFFVKEFAQTIDKVSDQFKPLDFILKLYSLINTDNPTEKQQFFDILKHNVKKSANKELISKAELNFSLHLSLSEKNIKSSFLKL